MWEMQKKLNQKIIFYNLSTFNNDAYFLKISTKQKLKN